MKSIHTIALNTAVDMRMVIPQFTYGEVMRSDDYSEFASGKAVNNARAITCLGGTANLYCFSGANDVDLFSSISPQIKAHVIAVDGATRRNLTLLEKTKELICHVQNHGYVVTDLYLRQLETILLPNIKEGDVVVISGSVPAGVPDDYLNDLMRIFVNRQTVILLDVDPELWDKVDSTMATIFKPNLQELAHRVGRELTDIGSIVQAATSVIDSEIVVVSLGHDGAIWIDRSNKSYCCGKTEVAGSGAGDVIGCGDAMVGAFALGMARGLGKRDVFKMGICSGYANIFCEGPGMLSMKHYDYAFDRAIIDADRHW